MSGIDGKQLEDASILNAKISPSAAIVESKLQLNFATHSNVLDPTADQKDALAGTSGTPDSGNPYVTDGDSRNSDDRDPTLHAIAGADHSASTLASLNGKISDATLDDSASTRTPSAHNLGGSAHNADTLANLNAKVSDATLIDTGDSRIPIQGENDALAGTSGTPSSSNEYVTDADFRNSNDRDPTVHDLGGADHNAATLAQLNGKVSDATLIDTGDSRLSDDRDPTLHALGGADHSASTLAALNGKVSDATLIDTNDSRLSNDRDPTSHAFAGGDHSTSTLGAVNSKISDATLINTNDSRLSDDRDPTSHAIAGVEHSTSNLAQLNGKITDATLIDGFDVGMVLLGTVVVGSPVATVVFTAGITSTYKFYKVLFSCVPVNDGVDFLLRTDANGGASFDTGAGNYRWGYVSVRTSGSIFQNRNNSATSISLAVTCGSDAGEGTTGEITLYDPASTIMQKLITCEVATERNTGLANAFRSIGQRQSTAIINALQFFFSAGNIESGVFHLFGIR